jgi:hypothetical protein
VLFRRDALDGIEAGAVTLAFRRWKRPRVRAGTRLRTRVGVLEIDSVEVVRLADLAEPDALGAGFGSVAELRAELRGREGRVYRIRLHLAGPDPRVELRGQAELGDDEVAAIGARLARLDAASRAGPWTRGTLELIAEQPGVRAADLAPLTGRERLPFKRDVRKLKELGLTESLEVGYRLSPRGRAVLERLGRDSP